MSSGSYFITGTDTGVGKTVVTAALAKGMKNLGMDVGVMKPLATGASTVDGTLKSEDALFLIAAGNVQDDYDLVNPIRFEPGLAPMSAAIVTGEEVDLRAVWDAFATLITVHDVILVEGIGGLLVPIIKEWRVIDVAVEMNLPLIVVARPGLGTLNHTALTVTAAGHAGLEVAGIVIDHVDGTTAGLAEETNLDLLEELTGVPVLANIPFVPGLTSDTVPDDCFREFLIQVED